MQYLDSDSFTAPNPEEYFLVVNQGLKSVLNHPGLINNKTL
jgi:hypothetical protein